MPGARRLVPDVNVLLSGVTGRHGPARELYLAAKRFDVVFVLCEQHFVEFRRILTYPQVLILGSGITPSEAFGLAFDLLQMAEMVQQVKRFDWPSCPDLKDWYLLSLLVTADTDGLVTRDRHLLRLHDELGLPVYEPRELGRLGRV